MAALSFYGYLLGSIATFLLRYIAWPLLLLAIFGPFGLIIWLFIH